VTATLPVAVIGCSRAPVSRSVAVAVRAVTPGARSTGL